MSISSVLRGAILCSLGLALVADAQENRTPQLASKPQVELLLKQADRAFLEYEQALQLEERALDSSMKAAVEKDRESLTSFRQIRKTLAEHPDRFNTSIGYLFVTILDDANLSMSACAGQVALLALSTGQGSSDQQRYIDAAMKCASVNLTMRNVAESADALYKDSLLARDLMLVDAMEKCGKVNR